jgi:glycopeptide antibiotics resistance protein
MESLLAEIILNILVFIPVGLLLGIALNTATWKKAFIIGVCISIMIEISQFIFKRGFTEFDDVIHNVVGCLIGYGLFCFVKWTWLKIERGYKKLMYE